MVTKAGETQRIEESLGRDGPQARVSTRVERLAEILKNKAAGRALFLAGDALALVVAHRTAQSLVQHFLQMPSTALNPPYYAVFYLPFLLGVIFVLERNQRLDLRRPEKEYELVVKGVSFGFLLLVCADFVVFKTGFSRYLMVSWYALTLVALLAVRFGLRSFYGLLWNRGLARQKTLLVGSVERLFELQTLLAIQRYRGYELLGIVPSGDFPPEGFANRALPILGSIERWHETAWAKHAEQVIVALEQSTPESHDLVSDILRRCLADGVDVQVYSDLFASREFNYELDEFSGFFRFFAATRRSKQVQMLTKKMLDFAAGAFGSLVTLLVFPVVAILIKIEDGGPVFYRREYFGRDRKAHYDLKFRTMHIGADRILHADPKLHARYSETEKLVDDPRVTRVGRVLRKYSIDELPQFFSVLTGQLSLVGPRVISREASRRYGERLPKLFSMKPGLTGYWQVMGRQLTSYEEHVRMDMFYIDHWSIWLDLWIIARTFWSVFRAEGAY